MTKTLLILALLFPFTSSAKDVGFRDVRYYIKVKIHDGADIDKDQLEFHLCPIESKDCFRLSSCIYTKPELQSGIDRIEDKDLKEEMEMLLNSSYQSRFVSTTYLPALFKLLRSINAKKKCALVTGMVLA